MRPASRSGKRNASAWLLLCRRRGRQCDGEWIASHPGPAKGGDWESEEGDPLRLSGRFQPVCPHAAQIAPPSGSLMVSAAL